VFFFFSSRRRHTRFSRDWSSDVCSSDLTTCIYAIKRRAMPAAEWIRTVVISTRNSSCKAKSTPAWWNFGMMKARYAWSASSTYRSEERRVGKEDRLTRAQSQKKKKYYER